MKYLSLLKLILNKDNRKSIEYALHMWADWYGKERLIIAREGLHFSISFIQINYLVMMGCAYMTFVLSYIIAFTTTLSEILNADLWKAMVVLPGWLLFGTGMLHWVHLINGNKAKQKKLFFYQVLGVILLFAYYKIM